MSSANNNQVPEQGNAAAKVAAGRRNTVKVDAARVAIRKVQVVDTDLVLTLDDGRTIYVRDGAVQAMVDQDFTLEFADGTQATGQDMLHTAQAADVGLVAATGAGTSAASTGVVVAQDIPSQATQAERKSPKWQTYALIGTPVIGGVLAGTMGGKSSSSASSSGGGSTVVPQTAVPVIDPVSGTDIVNAASKSAGVTIKGTAEASATVTVNFGDVQKTATADSTGKWSVSYTASEVPADALKVGISATAKSTGSTVSDPATRSVLVDTAGPAAPVIAAVTGDDVVSPTEKAAGVTVSGTSETGATVVVKWGAVTKTVVAGAGGAWSAAFGADEVPDAGSSTISATATDSVGNAGASGSHAVTVSPSVTVSGVVTAGPVTSTNDLYVSFYAGGKLLSGTGGATTFKVSATGSFAGTGLPVGQGETLTAVIVNGGTRADYADEATGSDKDLGATLYAIGVVSGATLSLNINPLTTIAGQKAGAGTDGTTVVTAAAATAANAAVASAFGLASSDVTQITPVATNSTAFNSTDGLSLGEQAGVALAALSGLDLVNGDAKVTLANTAGQITSAGQLDAAGQARMMVGAAAADGTFTGSLQKAVSDQLTPTSGSVTIAAVATDNIISAAEVTGLTLTGTVSAGASAVKLTLGTAVVNASVSGGTWSYALTSSDIAALGVDGAKVIQAEATLASGATASASRAVNLYVTPPATPTLATVAGNDAVSAAEQAAGVTLTGTANAGTSVIVSWGGITKTVVADASRGWSASFSTGEVPADGTRAVSVTSADAFGNSSSTVTRAVVVDRIVPNAPTIAAVNGSNLVGAAAKASGLTISGTGEAGATLVLTWGTFTSDVVTVASNGTWSVLVGSASIPSDGIYQVRAVQTDTGGNASVAASQQVTVKTTDISAPVILSATSDNIVNLTEKTAGVSVRGTGQAGATVTVAWGSVTKTATVNSSGSWSTTFTTAQVPADGTYTITATQRDTAGNTSVSSQLAGVTVDTSMGTPLITTVAGDGRIGADEKLNGYTVVGKADANSTVVVTVGSGTAAKSVTTVSDSSGNWTANFSAGNAPDDGAAVPVRAVATDSAGNTGTSATTNVIIDTLAPTTPTLSAVATDNKVNLAEKTASVTLTGTAEAFSTITVTWAGTTKTATVDLDGNWSVTYPAADVPRDGSRVLTVTATDAAGNVSVSATRSIDIDTVVPTLVLAPVAGNNAVNSAEKAASITVSGTTEAGATVSIDWAGSTGTATANSQGVWTYTFATANIPADGTRAITVSSVDAAGNSITLASRDIVIDTSPATVTLNDVTGNDIVNAVEKAAGVSVSGTAKAGTVVSLDWAGKTGSATAGADGTWTYTFPTADVPADGNRSLTVSAVDTAGNTTSLPARTVVVDTAAPAVTLAAVATDNQVNLAEKTAGVTVSGTAEAGATITLNWAGQTATTTATSAGAWSYTFATAAIPADGARSLTVAATDSAGNVNTLAARSIVVDSVLPTVVLNAIATDNQVNAAEKTAGVVISGTAEAGATVSLDWAGKTGTATADASGAWSFTYTTANLPADGSRTISVTAVDAVGNATASAVTRAITIDSAVPTAPTINAVATDNIVNTAEANAGVAISGTAEAGANVAITWGTVTQTATANASGVWTSTFARANQPGTNGATTVSVTQTDAAGNVSPAGTRAVTMAVSTVASPVINTVAGDDQVNLAEKTAGVTISGTTTSGTSVSVTWGSTTKTAVVSGTTWTATFTSSQVPADATTTISAIATDSGGNPSPATTRSVLVDSVAPTTPTINAVAGDNQVNVTEAAAGVAVSGTGQANSTITLVWGTKTRTVSVGPAGTWSTTFTKSAGDFPADGTYTITATATDGVGNSAQGTRAVLLRSEPTVLNLPIALPSNFDTGFSTTDGLTGNAVPNVRITGLTGKTLYAGDVIQVVDTSNGNAVLGSYTVQATDVANGVWTGTNTRQIDLAALSTGSHALALRVVDALGAENAVGTSSLTIRYDGQGPTFDLDANNSSGATGANYQASLVAGAAMALVDSDLALSDNLTGNSGVGSITLSATGLADLASEVLSVDGASGLTVNAIAASNWRADGSGVSTVAFTLGGVAWTGTYSASGGAITFALASGGAATDAQASALLSALRYADSAATITDGVRSFAITVTDYAGNTSTATANISYNAARPTVAATTSLVADLANYSASTGSVTIIDTDRNGVLGDGLRVTFSEAVQTAPLVGTANASKWVLSSGNLGTNASMTAVDPVTINGVTYATTFELTAGTASNSTKPSYTTGATITVAAANVIGTGGASDVASANVVFTIPDMTAPGTIGQQAAYNSIATTSTNMINAAEKATSTTLAFTANSPGDTLLVYRDGILVKSVVLGTATTTNVTFSGTDWGSSDGTVMITARLRDAAGNLGANHLLKPIVVDTTAPTGIKAMSLFSDTADSGGALGTANAGDVVQITFNEKVSFNAADLPSAFGTGATVSAVGAVGGYAEAWRVTLGTNPTIANGASLTIGANSVKDYAGNTGTVSLTAPAALFGATGTPGAPQIGNVTSDNVIDGTERGAAQTVTVNLSAAKAGDVVKLFMDGVQVGTTTVAAGSTGSVAFTIAANAWGGDGERVLTTSIQRGSGEVVAGVAERHVYVAADSAHWSAVPGAGNVLWMDPETLMVGQAVGTGTASAASASDYQASVGTLRFYAQTAGANPVAIATSYGRVQLVMDGTNSLRSSIVGALTTGSSYVFSTGAPNVYAFAAGQRTSANPGYLLTYGNNANGELVQMGTSGQTMLAGVQNATTNTLRQFLTDNAMASMSMRLSTSSTNSVNAVTWLEGWNSAGGFAVASTVPATTSANWQGMAIGGIIGAPGTSGWVGAVGDTILINGATLSANFQTEIQVYQAVKYRSLGSFVDAQGVGGTYDLTGSNQTVFLLDQVLLLNNADGAGADRVLVAGADYVQTGAGKDTVVVSDLNFRSLDGGTGFDTFTLAFGYTGASRIIFTDYISNARGISGGITGAGDARVNANGYHKLLGFEAIDLSLSKSAQIAQITFADIDQLAEKNLAGDPQAAANTSNLYLTLGSNDWLDVTSSALGSVKYGYWLDANGVAYDRQYSTTGTTATGGDAAALYVRGGDDAPDFGVLRTTASLSDTSISIALGDTVGAVSGTTGWSVLSAGSGITNWSVGTQNGASTITLNGTFNTATWLDVVYNGSLIADANGDQLHYKALAIGSVNADTINLSGKSVASNAQTGAGYAIFGNNGADTITGTGFDDLIAGGSGNDALTGGLGADTFRALQGDFGLDTITDFTISQGDKIDLRGLLKGTSLDGTVTWNADGTISTGSASALSGFISVTTSGSDVIISVDDQGAGSFAGNTFQYQLAGANAAGNLSGMTLTDLVNKHVVLIG